MRPGLRSIAISQTEFFLVKCDRRVCPDRNQPEAEVQFIPVVPHSFHRFFRFYFICMKPGFPDRTKLLQNLLRGFGANARQAGDIVRTVAHERFQFDKSFRRHSESRFHVIRPVSLVRRLPAARLWYDDLRRRT